MATTMPLIRPVGLTFAIALLVVTARAASGKVLNKSALEGLYWSTPKEEGDLGTKADTVWNDEDHRDLEDGGFSSLDGMLQWAIGHSDPSKLKEVAEDVQRSSPEELNERRREIKELIEKLKMPSDAELMRIAINDLNNSSLPWEDHLRALQELSLLVEPIDNAYGSSTKWMHDGNIWLADLDKLGGTTSVMQELNHPDPEIRTTSALVIGKACQNNPVVQKQFLELGVLSKLMKMTKSESVEEVIKALFAISSLIRNNLVGQELFYAEAGDFMIQDMLSKSNIDIRIHRKSVLIVADLAESQLENPNYSEPPFFSNPLFLRSLVDLLGSADLDLQEKVLHAIKNLLKLRSTEALVFQEFCELDATLEKIRQQLQHLVLEENHGEHAADVESLRREVEQIFIGKLNKITKRT